MTETTHRPLIAVAFYSGYGHTAVLAEAVQRGAEKAGAEVAYIPVDTITDEQWQQLDAADAIIFGSPTYYGGASAGFHAFAEGTGHRYVDHTWADKIAAGFTNSGSKSGDKLYTLNFMTALAAQHHMIWVGLGLAPGWNALTASEDDLNRLGFWIGAGAQTPVDGGTDAVHPADIATAEHLGARVTHHAHIHTAGKNVLATNENILAAM
ncbi:flavodoxin family protein [Rhodococcus sp. JVH1]|uniref:flavodoxin family protein n=1 Tax=Rhodococcus sp. JVH1 TaxID=745408 RepID=UPI000271F359|nr:flavodoxin family protein [Rhodococcus sp. JVH1]EJJ01744.1 flavodoxin family protein [Rhodococcus sp. JVH1]